MTASSFPKGRSTCLLVWIATLCYRLFILLNREFRRAGNRRSSIARVLRTFFNQRNPSNKRRERNGSRFVPLPSGVKEACSLFQRIPSLDLKINRREYVRRLEIRNPFPFQGANGLNNCEDMCVDILKDSC